MQRRLVSLLIECRSRGDSHSEYCNDQERYKSQCSLLTLGYELPYDCHMAVCLPMYRNSDKLKCRHRLRSCLRFMAAIRILTGMDRSSRSRVGYSDSLCAARETCDTQLRGMVSSLMSIALRRHSSVRIH